VKLRSFKTGFIVFVAMLLAIPLGVMGCGEESEGEYIRIGIMGGQTGPAPDVVSALIDEIELIFNYINEVEDGINGAQLKWQIEDNKGTPAGAITAYRTLKETFDPLMYIAVEDYLLLGEKDNINEDKSVIFTASAIMPDIFELPSRFFALPIPTSDGFGGFIDWAIDDFTGTGTPKIGVLTWGPPLTSGFQWKMALPYTMGLGVETVESTYNITDIDLTAPLTVLKTAEVDYIWMQGVTGNAAVAIGNFLGLDFDYDDDNVVDAKFCFSEYIESHKLIEMVGSAAAGFYVYRSETPWSDDSVAAQLYTDIYEHAGTNNAWSDMRHLITFKYILEDAVSKAMVGNNSVEDLNGEDIYQALLDMIEIDTRGNTGDFGYGPNKRIGVSTMKIAQFTATGTVSVSDEIQLPRTFE